MKKFNFLHSSQSGSHVPRSIWERFHIDLPLFSSILLLIIVGLFVLFSAGNENPTMITQQILRYILGFVVMIILAQIHPRYYRAIAPWLFAAGLAMLIAVMLVGVVQNGARRWLHVGLFRFQPSEIMKVAMPMMLAWFLSDKKLPPKLWVLAVCGLILLVPIALILKQPDLGTGLVVLVSGASVLLLAGIRWRFIVFLLLIMAVSAPLVWKHMHDYQRQRVITFLDPQSDPLGTGYHIIQSKIAIGSGGFFGKGWLHGTQSHLEFLPEHATDFIFAVIGEEFGLLGGLVLIGIALAIMMRCLYISSQAQDTFSRLLAGSLSILFFLSFFVNIGSVTGIVPVVGIPLPLVSYGGTAMVTFLASFGIIMSIHTHRKLLGS